MTVQQQDFVRQKVGAHGMTSLICVRCGKAVAHSDRPQALAIAEAVHARLCKGPVRPPHTPEQ